MKNIQFLSGKFHFLVGKISIYLNRHVFVMLPGCYSYLPLVIFLSFSAVVRPESLKFLYLIFVIDQ